MDKLTKRQIENRLATVSPTARKLYGRVNQYSNFYKAHDKKTPRAMQELINAGLVGIMGRVTRLDACFVPLGSTPAELERYP